ncbi:hypothetical protein PM3016_6074 [Paenibacillus mucilaginosus 3016]|uniref:Uncharacterized protein n=1 Tax=Paenibacillus mucilaginosus 3016 TaxID=1116391 RepID=H6NR28_9BACL|nr:hypothetical protein PM3016_6074 [Paenibacillus mucilaginosus 3016]
MAAKPLPSPSGSSKLPPFTPATAPVRSTMEVILSPSPTLEGVMTRIVFGSYTYIFLPFQNWPEISSIFTSSSAERALPWLPRILSRLMSCFSLAARSMASRVSCTSSSLRSAPTKIQAQLRCWVVITVSAIHWRMSPPGPVRYKKLDVIKVNRAIEKSVFLSLPQARNVPILRISCNEVLSHNLI